MGIREWMNDNSAIVTVGAVILLVVSLAMVVMQGIGGGPPTPETAWFMDLETMERFKADIAKIPPIESPAGNPAVKVHYFTCGSCTPEERFVGYYEKYTEKAKQRMLAARESEKPMMRPMMGGQLYSLDGENWVPAMTPAGTRVMRQLNNKCNGPDEQLRVCIP